MTEVLSCSTYTPLVEDRTGCLLDIGSNYVNPGIYKTTYPGFFPVQTQEDAAKYIDHSFTTRVDHIPMLTGDGYTDWIYITPEPETIYEYQAGDERIAPANYDVIMQPYLAAHPASSFVLATRAEAESAAPISSMNLSSYIPTTGFAYGNDVFWTVNTANYATLLGSMTLFGRISEDGQPLGIDQLDEMKLHTRETVVQRSFNARISNASGFGHYISQVVANVTIMIRLKAPCSYEFTYEEASTDVSQFKKKSRAGLGFQGYESNSMLAWPYFYTPTSSFQDEVNKDLLSTYYADDYWDRSWMPPLLSGADELVSTDATRNFPFLDFRSTVKEGQDIFFTMIINHNLAVGQRIPVIWHNIDTFKADRDAYRLTDFYYSQRVSPTPSYRKDYHKYYSYFCNSEFVSGYEQLTSSYFGQDTIIGDIQ